MTGTRALQVTIAAAGAVTLMLFLSGIHATERSALELKTARAHQDAPAPSARSYGDMRRQTWGPNATMYDGAFARLEADHPSLHDPVIRTEEDRAAALEKRASRRAYEGAPPTIPHKVLQMDTPSCLSCHEHGMRVANLVAPAMSHQRMDSCTQCHVVSADPRPVASTPGAPVNQFRGLEGWGRGSRAWPGAPPTIPHPTGMRSACDSCHGVNGAQGIRSTHPWRTSCTQCHAPSAVLDQHPPAPLSSRSAP
ncbi:MAG: nitrate reductase cytochrome c-type subunit [Polyangiaceae bacterium]